MQPVSRHSLRLDLLRFALVVGVATSARAQYSTDFEGVTATAGGTPLAGQDGYFIPPVAGSIDFNAFTYAGNTLSIPANPTGGAQFIAGSGIAGGPARAQRNLTYGTGVWTAGFDICATFVGTLPATQNIGSFSLQNSTTERSFIALSRWADTGTATHWNADYVWADAGGASLTEIVPDPAFQNLPIDTWFRRETDYDLSNGAIVEVRLTNLATGTTVSHNPVGRFLTGTVAALPAPTAFRFFAGGSGAGNVLAFDNTELGPVGPGTLGTRYCTPAVPNSTGNSTRIDATGSNLVAMNNVTLAASDLPNNAFGFFITSLTQGNTPQPGGSLGVLCLGGSIGRYVGPGQIQNSGGAGAFTLTINLSQHPTPTGLIQVQAGQTWNFQCWHRDSVGGSAVSNFSDALSIAFQ